MIRQYIMITSSLARSSRHQYPPTLSTINGSRWVWRPMTSIAKTDEKEKLADDAPRITPSISLCQLNDHPDYRLQQAKARLANRSGSVVKTVRNGVSSFQSIESPIRSNDGTSSGAIAADRLRMARRKALQNISQIEQSSPRRVKPTSQTSKDGTSNVIKEHGIDITAIESKVKKNDGTSSGATAADRLRMARRRVIEKMKQQSDG